MNENIVCKCQRECGRDVARKWRGQDASGLDVCFLCFCGTPQVGPTSAQKERDAVKRDASPNQIVGVNASSITAKLCHVALISVSHPLICLCPVTFSMSSSRLFSRSLSPSLADAHNTNFHGIHVLERRGPSSAPAGWWMASHAAVQTFKGKWQDMTRAPFLITTKTTFSQQFVEQTRHT